MSAPLLTQDKWPSMELIATSQQRMRGLHADRVHHFGETWGDEIWAKRKCNFQERHTGGKVTVVCNVCASPLLEPGLNVQSGATLCFYWWMTQDPWATVNSQGAYDRHSKQIALVQKAANLEANKTWLWEGKKICACVIRENTCKLLTWPYQLNRFQRVENNLVVSHARSQTPQKHLELRSAGFQKGGRKKINKSVQARQPPVLLVIGSARAVWMKLHKSYAAGYKHTHNCTSPCTEFCTLKQCPHNKVNAGRENWQKDVSEPLSFCLFLQWLLWGKVLVFSNLMAIWQKVLHNVSSFTSALPSFILISQNADAIQSEGIRTELNDPLGVQETSQLAIYTYNMFMKKPDLWRKKW